MTRGELLDRRPPYHGDRRRAALLEAMDELLRERGLDDVTIADVTARAGVTRSAFYFYFENKAACAAALGTALYEAVFAAAANLVAADRSPRQRIEATIHGVFAAWRGDEYLYRAMLAARQTNDTVRTIWADYRASFVAPVAAMIDADRATALAPAGPDARALATVLLEVTDRMLEQVALGDPLGLDERAEVLIAIWLRTIYGVVDEDELIGASHGP